MVILTQWAQTPPSLPLQGTVPLCWLTPPSMLQMSKAMKTHGIWAVQLDTPFTRWARFKGKGMVDVSADAVLPLLDQPQAMGASQHHLSGKNPVPGAQGGWNWVYIKKGGFSYTSGPRTRAKYLKGREEALWGTSALTKMSGVLASEDNHGDPGKSGIIFHGTSPPPHCLWGKNSLGCFVDGVIYSPNTASTCMDTYCVAKKNSGR